MSKKSGSSRSNWDIVQVLCYVALFVGAVIWLLEALQVLDKMGQVGNVLRLIRELSVFFAIALGAYPFAKRKQQPWLAIYWVIIVVILIGIFFGTFTSIINFPWAK